MFNFTCELKVGVEKVVPEILGRGGAVSGTIRSLAASCITEWSQENGRGKSKGGGGTPISFRNVNEPAATSNECLILPFFSLLLSLLPLLFVSLSLLLARLFDSRRLHLSFSWTMAVIPLSPVTQKPPEGDGNDVPPIRIMTNQTIEKERPSGLGYLRARAPLFLLQRFIDMYIAYLAAN